MKRLSWLLVLVMVLLASSFVSAEPRVVDMEFKNAPVVDVFQILGELAGKNVLVDPSVSGQLSFYLQDLPVTEALDLVAKTTGFGYRMVGNTLVVATEARLREEFSTTGSSFVPVNHVTVADVQRLLGVVSPQVRVYGDDRLNLVVLYGTDDQLLQARDVIRQYDQPQHELPPTPEVEAQQFERYTLALEYADGERLAAQLSQIYPDREIRWMSDSRVIQARVSEQEINDIRQWLRARDLPEFQVRGIVAQQEAVMVLVEHEGVTDRMRVGSTLIGWTLTAVDDKIVTFEKDGRSFTAAMGR